LHNRNEINGAKYMVYGFYIIWMLSPEFR